MSADLHNIVVPFKFSMDDEPIMLAEMAKLKERWNIGRILLIAPDKKVRISGFPDRQLYEDFGRQLKRVIAHFQPLGVDVGWWCYTSFKSGPSPYQKITGIQGTTAGISSCPLDPAFARTYCENIALVARIAKPSTILIEDDYQLSQHPGINWGCFCPLHLAAFATQVGRAYAREELHHLFLANDDQAKHLRGAWAELSRRTLAGFAEKIRRAVDEVSPATRIGLCQPGSSDKDGGMTQSVAQALAGPNARPLVRLFGTSYSSNDSGQSLPAELFHALYDAQHLPENFELLHETDTYPHTRFFSSAARIESQLLATCAHGLDGSFFHGTQNLDVPLEEQGYLDMLSRNAKRLETLRQEVRDCQLDGCQIVYRHTGSGSWSAVLGRYGIPFTTTPANVKLISGQTPSLLSDGELEELLSGSLLLDGQAANLIAARGCQQLIGVQCEPGKHINFCLEKICPHAGFTDLPGSKIYNFLYAPAGGEQFGFTRLIPLPGTEVLTEYLDPADQPIQPGLTRCINSLGGRIGVLAANVDGNNSSSLFCYRKKEILLQLLEWLNHDKPLPAAVLRAPNVFVTFNRQIDHQHAIMTICNLSADTLPSAAIRLASAWSGGSVLELQDDGQWAGISVHWKSNHSDIPGPFPTMRTRLFKFITQASSA